MCGITGWANLDSRTPPPDGARELLHSMCERMVHRGPDSEGLLVSQGVALGMRRLAIIDLVPANNLHSTRQERAVILMAITIIVTLRQHSKAGQRSEARRHSDAAHLSEVCRADFDILTGFALLCGFETSLLLIARETVGRSRSIGSCLTPPYYSLRNPKVCWPIICQSC